MKNPYKILNLTQDASAVEIARAQISALRSKQYSNREITEAQATLRKPASRLAADFTFPILDRGELKPLTTTIKSKNIDLSNINIDKYDSTK